MSVDRRAVAGVAVAVAVLLSVGLLGRRLPSAARVDAAARAVMLRPDEVPHEALAWAPSLDEALARARSTHRMVLLVLSRGEICSGRL